MPDHDFFQDDVDTFDVISGTAPSSALTFSSAASLLATGFNAVLDNSFFQGLALTGLLVGVGRVLDSSIGMSSNAVQLDGFRSPNVGKSVLVNKASSSEQLYVVYGERRVGGVRVFVNADGEHLDVVLAMADGEVDSVVNIYFNDDLSTDSQFTSEIAETTVHLGADDQSADSVLVSRVADWTAEHKLSGVVYIYARLKFDQDVWHGGIPTITADIKGTKVFDPRDSSTAWSDNPALCIRDYLTNDRYGRGIPSAQIDDTAIISAANFCDEMIEKGGSSQKRYTCNGVVNVDDESMTTVRKLLSSCRGMLIFSAGKYKLVIDKVETPSFTFDEDNIIGSWTISMGSKTSMFNRCKAKIFNKDRSWQDDFITIDSPALRELDNDLMLQREIQLPFTSDEVTARQITTINLNQSRQQLAVEFNATIKGMRAEVGDVVYITHSTPAWTNKAFRVMEISMMGTSDVKITAVEYDATTYDFGTISTVDATPNTNLPDMTIVASPVAPLVSESIYQTLDGSAVKAKASISWTASTANFISHYVLEYKESSETDYLVVTTTQGLTAEILDIAPAIYDFRLKVVNTAGVSSEFSSTHQEIFALSVKPSALTNFQAQSASSLTILTWDESPDIDVRVGGKIEIRHSSLLSGATWAESVSVNGGIIISGNATNVALPLLAGTYIARAFDSSGLQSDISTVTTEAATLQAFSTVGLLQAHPNFNGTHDDTVMVDSKLRLQGQVDIDSWTDVDSLELFDLGQGGVDTGGTYYFSSGIDAGTVKTQQLTRTISSIVAQPLDKFDDRTALINTWLDFDGTEDGAGDCKVFVRHTDDDPSASPTWSVWKPLTVTTYTARGFQFKADLSVSDPIYNINVSELSVTAQELS